MSNPASRISHLVFLAALAGGRALPQQQQTDTVKSRDLTMVRLADPEELKMPVRVPRGYAVVIGISTYKNLAPKDNLAFAERDAENLYSALISKEIGRASCRERV